MFSSLSPRRGRSVEIVAGTIAAPTSSVPAHSNLPQRLSRSSTVSKVIFRVTCWMPLSVNVVRLQDRSSVTLEVRGAKTDVVAAVESVIPGPISVDGGKVQVTRVPSISVAGSVLIISGASRTNERLPRMFSWLPGGLTALM
ncbi:hypothetical protein DSECCO2_464220 [anaerobic digester metagenome]